MEVLVYRNDPQARQRRSAQLQLQADLTLLGNGETPGKNVPKGIWGLSDNELASSTLQDGATKW